MNIDDRLKALARQGHGDSPPAVDVADRIVQILTTSPHMVVLLERLWMWMAGLSCAAAVAVLVVAVPFYDLWNDPFLEVMETISWVIQ